ncbi:hypothetical protein HFU84_13975 [Acidithiobacillus sp. CV18-2]|nr:hypothetical protein [Acidithiobacillus sp. CV18-3]MBU2756039.1 hypothetical protein [Acidithiobacillus sp. BN09-2]MBU2778579.1 hypothetical protein [Acidithiobacillus sp. CV18-2]MBU2795217.1 hypothetical protein [Acidithiobacillus sp. VAN18-2]MBU2798493.1 hypothetical protein [Acidithiobacillus sp. VAN18-4]
MLSAMMYAVVNRVVAVITWLPTSVMRWFGRGGGQDMQEAHHETVLAGGVKSGANSGMGSASSAVQGVISKDKQEAAAAASEETASNRHDELITAIKGSGGSSGGSGEK